MEKRREPVFETRQEDATPRDPVWDIRPGGERAGAVPTEATRPARREPDEAPERPVRDKPAPALSDDPGPKGLGGLLLIPLLALAGEIGLAGYQMPVLVSLWPALEARISDLVGSGADPVTLRMLVYGFVALTVLNLAVAVFALGALLLRQRAAPRLIILHLVLGVAAAALAVYTEARFMRGGDILAANALPVLVVVSVLFVIGSLYLMTSRRVRNTFGADRTAVRRDPGHEPS